jgi:hypothetical protein
LIVEPSEEAAMAYVMCQYDRPTDTRNWNDYNQRVGDWIAQLLKLKLNSAGPIFAILGA